MATSGPPNGSFVSGSYRVNQPSLNPLRLGKGASIWLNQEIEPEAKVGLDKAQIQYRRALAAELRCQGREYAEIAEIVGYASKSGAWHAVQRALDARTVAAADHLVATSFLDLELVQSAAWPAAMKGDLRAAATVVEAIDLRVQLIDRYGTALGLPDDCARAADAADAFVAAQAPYGRVSRDPEDVFENSELFVFVRLSGPFRGRTVAVDKHDMRVRLYGDTTPSLGTSAEVAAK